jgi:hypothetical protein
MSAALKGENCTLSYIRGVKVLEDSDGVDLLKLIKKGLSKNPDVDVESSITKLLLRMDALEKFVKNIPLCGVAGPMGVAGPAGEDGAQGIPGAQGPRGKDGAKTLSALTDVCLDGLDDNAGLIYSEKDKKWMVSIE